MLPANLSHPTATHSPALGGGITAPPAGGGIVTSEGEVNGITKFHIPEIEGMNGTRPMCRLERHMRTVEKKELSWVMHNQRQEAVRKAVVQAGNARTRDGFGQLERVISAKDFHHFGRMYGYEIWDDPEWLREWDRDNPDGKAKQEGRSAHSNIIVR